MPSAARGRRWRPESPRAGIDMLMKFDALARPPLPAAPALLRRSRAAASLSIFALKGLDPSSFGFARARAACRGLMRFRMRGVTRGLWEFFFGFLVLVGGLGFCVREY